MSNGTGFVIAWIVLLFLWPVIWEGIRRNPVFIGTWLVLILGWQVISKIVPWGTLEHPIFPGWDYVFGTILKTMSGHWNVETLSVFGWFEISVDGWVPYPSEGGDHTWLGTALALLYHSIITLTRLLTGLIAGLAIGLFTGLAIPYWPTLRKLAWTPMNFMRMIPLLAAIPWLQWALGPNIGTTTLFISFGVWVTLVVASINSVANVPDRYVESARTLGASRLRTYLTVVVPGALPELRTALLLSAGLAWSLTIASGFLGFPSGLGYLANVAVENVNTARLVIVAFVVALYSLLTFFFLNKAFQRAVSWMPQLSTEKVDITKVAGVAGIGRSERG
jgi:ABC-type nitrate/sulfonate/bicarbonate transport system permease component